MNKLLRLGILGLGNKSTLFYLDQLNHRFNKKHGGYSTAPFVMLNTNFDEINPYLPDDFSTLEPVVSNYLRKLEQMGCDTILIPNITLHRTVDRLVNNNLNVLHPIRITANYLKKTGVKEIVLFGSIYTMQSEYFNALGVQIIQPSVRDMRLIDTVRKDVYSDIISTETTNQFQNLVSTYSKLAPVVLACTELSMIGDLSLNNAIIDMVDLQLKAALKILEE